MYLFLFFLLRRNMAPSCPSQWRDDLQSSGCAKHCNKGGPNLNKGRSPAASWGSHSSCRGRKRARGYTFNSRDRVVSFAPIILIGWIGGVSGLCARPWAEPSLQGASIWHASLANLSASSFPGHASRFLGKFGTVELILIPYPLFTLEKWMYPDVLILIPI